MQPTTYLCLYVLYGNESKVYMPHTPTLSPNIKWNIF